MPVTVMHSSSPITVIGFGLLARAEDLIRIILRAQSAEHVDGGTSRFDKTEQLTKLCWLWWQQRLPHHTKLESTNDSLTVIWHFSSLIWTD